MWFILKHTKLDPPHSAVSSGGKHFLFLVFEYFFDCEIRGSKQYFLECSFLSEYFRRFCGQLIGLPLKEVFLSTIKMKFVHCPRLKWIFCDYTNSVLLCLLRSSFRECLSLYFLFNFNFQFKMKVSGKITFQACLAQKTQLGDVRQHFSFSGSIVL